MTTTANGTPITNENIEKELARVLALQCSYKHPKLASFCCHVVRAALAADPQPLWPDAAPVVAAVAQLGGDDKNMVGTAWRMLASVKILERRSGRRRSTAGPSKGREIAEYALVSPKLARVFLERNGAAALSPQKELFK